MRRALALVAAVTALAVALPASAAPGDAFEDRQHIKALKVTSIAVSDQSCQHINVTVTTTRGVGYVETGFHAGGQEVAHLTIDTPDGYGYDYLQWCPDAGLGHYRAGPSQLCGTDSFDYDYCFKKDDTRTDFYVRRFSRLAASRSGSTVTAHLTAYSLTARRYTAASGVKVRLMSGGRVVDQATTSHGTAVLHGSGGRVVAVPTATVAGAHKSL